MLIQCISFPICLIKKNGVIGDIFFIVHITDIQIIGQPAVDSRVAPQCKVMPEISSQIKKDLPADLIIGEILVDHDLLAAGLDRKDIAGSSKAVIPVIQRIISGIKSS